MKPPRLLRSLPRLFLLVLLIPAVAAADEFSDFRIPEHTWQSASAQFSLTSFGGRGSSDLTASRSHSGFGSLSLDLVRAFDSDRLQHRWEVLGSGNARAFHNQTDSYYPGLSEAWIDHDGRSQATGQALELLQWGRWYPGESAVGFSWSADVLGVWAQSWARSRESIAQPAQTYSLLRSSDSDQEHVYRYSAEGNLGLGYGRVRDATPVEDVHVLEERLRESGVLVRPISSAAREALAGILLVAPRMRSAHERPTRYLWREIEQVLVNDGAVARGALDAYALSRAMEPVVGRIACAKGQILSATIGLSHDHIIGRREEQHGNTAYEADTLVYRADVNLSSRQDTSNDEVVAGLVAEWHRPVGWAWQFDASGAVRVPVRPGEKGVQTDARVTAAWHVTDLWLATGTLSQRRDYFEPGDPRDALPRDSWYAGAMASLQYFLEDHTALFVRGEEGQLHSRTFIPLSPATGRFFQASYGISAGLTYRFLGRVSAPGLFETMTPM